MPRYIEVNDFEDWLLSSAVTDDQRTDAITTCKALEDFVQFHAGTDSVFIGDCIGFYKRVIKLPNCNDCGMQKTGPLKCSHIPGWGEQVRINCPLWKPKEPWKLEGEETT